MTENEQIEEVVVEPQPGTYYAPDGSAITKDQATMCYPTSPKTSPLHDWFYLGKAESVYKCKRCGFTATKAALKYLTDGKRKVIIYE